MLRTFTPYVLLAVVLTGGGSLWAQANGAAEPAPEPSLTTDTVETARKALAELGLDAETVDKADSYYTRAAEALKAAADHQKKTAKYTESLTEAAAEIERVRAALAEPIDLGPPVEELAEGLSLTDAETKLRAAQAKRDEATTALDKLIDEQRAQRVRPAAINDAITEATKMRAEVTQKLTEAPAVGEAEPVTAARRVWLRARERMRTAELRMLEQEQASYDVRLTLLGEQVNRATREAKAWEDRTNAWQQRVIKMREDEARRVAAEKAAEAARLKDVPEAIREIAEANAELAGELEDLAGSDAEIIRKLDAAKRRAMDIENELELNQQRIELAARSETVGLVLRQERESLPDVRAVRQAWAARAERVAQIVGRQIEIDQQRRRLIRSPREEAERVVASIDPPVAEDRREELIEQTQQLEKDRRDLLGRLYEAQVRRLGLLNDLDIAERKMATMAGEYAELIDTHLLWLRSAPPVGLETLTDSVDAAAWMASTDQWAGVFTDAFADARREPIVWLMGVGGAIALIALRRWSRRRLIEIAADVGRVSTDSFMLTLRAIVLTVVAASGWATLAGVLGWRLLTGFESSPFTRAVGAGLATAAVLWATLALLREMNDKGGLTAGHFRWPENTRSAIRGAVVWLMAIVVPAAFLAAALSHADRAEFAASLGRIAYIVATFATAVCLGRLLRPNGPIVSAMLRRRRDGWAARLRWLWYPLAAGLPLLLALLAGFGYAYTAVQLSWRLLATIWIVLALIIVHGTLMRALFVAARRIAFEEAKRRREEARRKREEAAERGEEEEDDDELPAIEVPEINIDQISEHTQKLVQLLIIIGALVGIGLVWADALPALSVLNDMHIAGTPLTIGMVIAAILALTVTVIAARNLPGFLEIVLLSRLPLDAGARYAVTSLSRYVIVAVGIIAAFNALGFDWDSVQWLVAALGVGLGFGLQEIVANFVSGIIILFERPFRVGDFVTVNDTEGWVTRIRIRATTITTLERRELIVPNKEFITGQIINWSLSDSVIRIGVPVGIVYGTDTDLAEKLFLEAARENEDVLDSPEPKALFLGFGDNSLNYDVRIWIDDVAYRYDIIHQMHKSIDKKCRDAGIVIAFPQRDVHLDQIGPLKIQLERAKREADKSE